MQHCLSLILLKIKNGKKLNFFSVVCVLLITLKGHETLNPSDILVFWDRVLDTIEDNVSIF